MDKRIYWLKWGGSLVVFFLLLQLLSVATESHDDVALLYYLTNGPILGILNAFPFTLEQRKYLFGVKQSFGCYYFLDNILLFGRRFSRLDL